MENQNGSEKAVSVKETKPKVPHMDLFITTGPGWQWPKVGAAWLNKDGSLNLRLRKGVTLTAEDKLQMRQAKEISKKQEAELGE